MPRRKHGEFDYVTSDDDFKLFVAEIRRLIEVFGLQRYTFYYFHGETSTGYNPNENGGQASCLKTHRNNAVNIGLGEEIICVDMGGRSRKQIVRERIKEIALHELMHVLVFPLQTLGESRFVSEEEIHEQAESLVIALTNGILRLSKR